MAGKLLGEEQAVVDDALQPTAPPIFDNAAP
jgi:hypothetical protein